jgi:hypothetical protein
MDDMETLERKLLGTKKQSRYGLMVLILKMCSTEPKNKSDIYFGNPKRFTYAALHELIGQCLKRAPMENALGEHRGCQAANPYACRPLKATRSSLLSFLPERPLLSPR